MENEQPPPEREQHDQAFDDLGLAAAQESPPPAPPPELPELAIPVPDIQEPPPVRPTDEVRELADVEIPQIKASHDAVLGEMGAVAADELPKEQFVSPETKVEQRARDRANERKQRLGKPPIVQHNEAFGDLGFVSFQNAPVENYGDEPLMVQPGDRDDMAFPHKDQSAEASSAFRDYLEQDRRWKNSLTDFVKLLTSELTQHRLELDLLRGQLERSRLS